jgi:hypothetical protein
MVRTRVGFALVGAGLLACAGAPGSPAPRPTAPAAGADSAAAHTAAIAFLAAFDSLQWEPFRSALAPEVTVFGNAEPRRLDGRAAVVAHFEPFFTQVRAARAQ